jgi:hypothetical protein
MSEGAFLGREKEKYRGDGVHKLAGEVEEKFRFLKYTQGGS